MCEIIDLFENIIFLVIFKWSLLTLNDVCNWFNYSHISLHNADKSRPDLNKLVLSANEINYLTLNYYGDRSDYYIDQFKRWSDILNGV